MTDEQYPYQDELNARRLRNEADDKQVAFNTIDSLVEQRDKLEQQLADQRKVMEALLVYIQFCRSSQNFDADLIKKVNNSQTVDDFITKILAAE